MHAAKVFATVASVVSSLHVGIGTPDAWTTHTPDWACIRWRESGDNYRAVGYDGRHFGAYQFSLRTWDWLGYSGNPVNAAVWVQNHAALKLWHWSLRIWGDPWHPWVTAALCGL